MAQVKVTAIANFEHNGRRVVGDVFSVSAQHAVALERAGLVEIDAEEHEASQSKSAAPPAAPAPARGAAPATPGKAKKTAVE